LLFFWKKEKQDKRKPVSAFGAVSCWVVPWAVAQLPHARKVFEVGLGEGLFSKSPSPIKELGNLFFKKGFPLQGRNFFQKVLP
jgi:hypothetical protein